MSSEPNIPSTVATDETEPKAERAPAPILLIGLFALIAFWGMLYLENHGGGFSGTVYQPYESAEQEVIDRPYVAPDPKVHGAQVFMKNCVVCHQATGLGQPGTFPPLAGSEWVNAKGPNRVIRIVLNGLGGPIQVKGQAFNNNMATWKAIMTDQDIADVLTFVRGNKDWGNDASPVSPEQVAALRKELASRDTPFTPEELLKLPDADDAAGAKATPVAAPAKTP
jgi:mono/diheme cytochrome c family protein